MKKVNRKLKGRIIERFGTQVDFAQFARENDQVVSRVVNGRQELSDEKRQKWGLLLDADPDDLFGKRQER